MAYIRPFRAIRYNPAVVGDLQKVVAPPYDVISPQQQTLLHMQSPYNAVHLDFSQESDPYAAAAQTFQTWLSQQVVQQDPAPAFYCYSQEFSLKNGQQRRRTGIFTALRLEEFESGIIRPHERTFEPAKKDRLALLRACQAHLSSIFCLYSGSAESNWSLEQTLQAELAQPAAVDIHDDAGVTHRLWPITNPDSIADLRARLADESLIIADGHHRYETALQYCREQASEIDPNGSSDSTSSTGEEPFRYVLAYLTNAQDAGLTILPTHRLIQQTRLPSPASLQAVLKRDFRLARYALTQRDAFLAALAAPIQNGRYGQNGPERRIGCVLAGAEHYWLLSFDDRVTHGLQASEAIRGLDVTVLHDVIFQRFLGLPPEVQKGAVSYTSDEDEALRLVAERQCQAAFLLRSTTFEQIKRVCEGGETMPQKSTYFYPKLLTGLVFYHLGKE